MNGSGDKSRDFTTQYYTYTCYFKDDEFFMCAFKMKSLLVVFY